MIFDLEGARRREVQAIGAAISMRNWHGVETAYNALRDKMDAVLHQPKPPPSALSPQTLPAPGEVPEGMKPWAGGDAAPVDWDGGPVTLRNGSTMFPSNVSLAYHANGTDRWNHQRENRNPAWDIIAYSTALATVAAANDEGVADAIEAAAKVAENPGFIEARDTEWDAGVNYAKRYIADAIRRLATSRSQHEGAGR